MPSLEQKMPRMWSDLTRFRIAWTVFVASVSFGVAGTTTSMMIAFPLVGLSGAMYAGFPVTLMSALVWLVWVVMSLIISSRKPFPRSVTDWLVASWLKSTIVTGLRRWPPRSCP